jgi:hypothetical protein
MVKARSIFFLIYEPRAYAIKRMNGNLTFHISPISIIIIIFVALVGNKCPR